MSFKNRRVLITGADGFVGHFLTARLIADGAIVSVIDRMAPKSKRSVDQMIGDLRDKAFVRSSVRRCRPEFVFHLAATKDRSPEIPDFYKAIEVNLLGTLNLLSALKSIRQLRSAIVMGTAEEYGHNQCPFKENMREMPVSSYSFSKACMTQLCGTLSRLHRIPVTVIRPTLAYGPGQDTNMFLPSLITELLNRRPFSMTLGAQTRDYIYVTDLVDALIRASLAKGHKGAVFNIGSGKPVKLARLASMAAGLLGKNDLVKLGKKAYRAGEIMEYYVDNSKAKKKFGWSPQVNLKEGLIKTVNYYKEISK
jgi:UDP-glucose 4-epimerase